METDHQDRPLRVRFASALDRLENTYLRFLRAAILLIATFLILGALVLAAYSGYRMSRSVDSVVEKTAVVAAAEIVDAEQTARDATRASKSTVSPIYQNFYGRFIREYHRLFRNRFEPFRQRDDKQLSVTEFGDSFIDPTKRIEAITKGELNFEEDRRDLESLLTVMTEAAGLPQTQQRLKRYMNARKVQVCETIQRTRAVTQSGWDQFSMDCPDWYREPTGCPIVRTVNQPYSTRECRLEYPPGTQSHSEIFRALQDKYLGLLHQRRETNAADAAMRRSEIEAGQLAGAASLVTALQIVGAFLVLMFFFLLIAIERHQRAKST